MKIDRLFIKLTILIILLLEFIPLFFAEHGNRQPKSQVDIRAIINALDLFKLDVGRYPTEEEGLEVLVYSINAGNIEGYNSLGYLTSHSIDRWGRSYRYKCDNGKDRDCVVFTYGKDGKSGGEEVDEDIISHLGLY